MLSSPFLRTAALLDYTSAPYCPSRAILYRSTYQKVFRGSGSVVVVRIVHYSSRRSFVNMISNYRVIKEPSAAGCSALTLVTACGVIHHPLDPPSLASERVPSGLSAWSRGQRCADWRRCVSVCRSVGHSTPPVSWWGWWLEGGYSKSIKSQTTQGFPSIGRTLKL